MKITVREYIEHTGMSSQRVGSMIRRDFMPPGIIKAEKFGQTYVLHAKKNWKELAQPLEKYQRVKVGPADETDKF
ncbi:MAG: hypothetical protein ACI7YS_17410 [Flavobacterium sp.]